MTNLFPNNINYRQHYSAPSDLWEHQAKSIEICADRFAFLYDAGTGKTRTVIEVCKKQIVRHQLPPQKIVVVCPLNVARNWPKQLDKYWGMAFEVYMLAGEDKDDKIEALKSFRATPAKHNDMFIFLNIEMFRSKRVKNEDTGRYGPELNPYISLISDIGAQFLIIDECHNFKTANSAQTKGLLKVEEALRPKFLYLMSGTPAPQGEVDLWSTLYLMRKTKDDAFTWKKRHFHDKNAKWSHKSKHFPKYVLNEGASELLAKQLSECSMVARKSEVLDLPPLLRTTIYAEMSKVQAKHYETMKEFLFAIDEDGNELNAANLLSRTIRLQQILAGFLGVDEQGRPIAIKNNPRLEALDQAIEKTNGEQFLIWTIFSATYKQIAERLEAQGISYGLLTGEQSAAERAESIERFQAGELRCLIGHPKAGGVGIELQRASYSINYTRSFNLVDWLQSEARNYRGGSEIHKRVTQININVPATIDEEITEALIRKESAQDFILGLKKRHL